VEGERLKKQVEGKFMEGRGSRGSRRARGRLEINKNKGNRKISHLGPSRESD